MLFPESIRIESNMSLSIYSLLILFFFIIIIIIGFILELILVTFTKKVKDKWFLGEIITISLFAFYLFIIENIVNGIETSLIGKGYIGTSLILIFMGISMLQKKLNF